MEIKDEKLWATAQQRANFKKELFTYIIINVFLWALWLVTGNNNYNTDKSSYNNIPWPVWVTLGWGIGIAFKYYKVYHTNDDAMAEKEYKKLQEKK
jgi:hypothetical protein